MKEVNAIGNANERSNENMKLNEEMLGDPTMKKIASKYGESGLKKISSILNSIN
jgi:hypothetical protein